MERSLEKRKASFESADPIVVRSLARFSLLMTASLYHVYRIHASFFRTNFEKFFRRAAQDRNGVCVPSHRSYIRFVMGESPVHNFGARTLILRSACASYPHFARKSG